MGRKMVLQTPTKNTNKRKRLQETFRRSMELHATSHKFIQIDGTTTICVQQDAQRPDAMRVSNDACKFWKNV